MNDDEPFEIHRTGHRGRLLCLLVAEYAQDNKTGGFGDNMDLQFREARNLQNQKHIQIDVIIFFVHCFKCTYIRIVKQTFIVHNISSFMHFFVSVNVQTGTCRNFFRVICKNGHMVFNFVKPEIFRTKNTSRLT